jgi:hypothetical protein
VADESSPDNIRMMAALIFKNFVANRGGVILVSYSLLSAGLSIPRLLGELRQRVQRADKAGHAHESGSAVIDCQDVGG